MDDVQAEAPVIRFRAGAVGFRLLFWAIVAATVYGLIVGFFTYVVGPSASAPMGLPSLAFVVLMVVGLLMLRRAVPDVFWRRCATLTLGLYLVPFAMSMISLVRLPGWEPDDLWRWDLVVAGLLGTLSQLIFWYMLLTLVRHSGQWLHRRTLVRSADNALKAFRVFLWALMAFLILAVAPFALNSFLDAAIPWILHIMLLAGLGTLLVGLIFFLLNLKALWGAGTAYARRAPRRRRHSRHRRRW